MAKQAGPFFFTGTIGDVIFYKLGDQYLMRMKGDYNKKRMQKPGAYPLMQLRQQEFGQASKLASQVYRLLPRAQKKKGLFGQYTKAARKLLRQGKTHEEILAALQLICKGEKVVSKQDVPTNQEATSGVKKAEPKPKAKEQKTLTQQAIPAGALLINGQVYLPLQEYQLLANAAIGNGEVRRE
jgi:hypothetical protein